MKALSLTMQAFGPFANTHVIDFRFFGDSSLYLINGKTGSGKTTILDAISFALYGDTTGKEREAMEMRCNYAKDDLLTEVIFEFKLAEKTYRLQRLPRQYIKKTRGEGVTLKLSEANLWEINSDGSESLMVSKKLTDVTQKVVELIGLNSEQFRQVMVLPQGRFRELLLADSKNREEIFSQLFQTQIYKQVEEDIKVQAKTVKDQIGAYNAKMTTILESADLNSESDIDQALLELTPQHKSQLLHKKQAAKDHQQAVEDKQVALNLQQQFNQLSIEQKNWAEHQQHQADVNQLKAAMQRAMTADKLRPLFDDMSRLKKEELKLKQLFHQSTLDNDAALSGLNVANERAQTANVKAQALDGLHREYDKLQSYQGAILTLEAADKEKQDANALVNSKYVALEQVQGILQQHGTALNAAEQRLDALQTLLNKEVQTKLNEVKLTHHIKMLKESEHLNNALKNKQQEGEQANVKVEQALKNWQLCQKTAYELQMRWHLGQAAILANTLQHDQACPVCGSLEHPHPAQWQDANLAVDKTQLDEAQAHAIAAQKVHGQAENRLTALRSEYAALKVQLDQLTQALSGYAPFTLVELQAQWSEVQQIIAQLATAQIEQTQIMSDIRRLKQKREALDINLKNAQADLNAQQTQLQLKDQAWLAIQSQLPERYRDSVALQTQIKALQRQIDDLKYAQETAKIALEAAKSRADKAQQSTDNVAQQVKDVQLNAARSQQDWQVALQKSDFINESAFQTAQWTQVEYEQKQETIKRFEERLNQLRGAIQQLETSLAGKTNPDLNSHQQHVEVTKIALESAETTFNKADQKIALLNLVKQKLVLAQQENQLLLEEYKVIGTLSEVLSGKEGDKVSLQRFVLSLLLNDVLDVASQRLKMMSKGRYELIRKVEANKGSKASGLDLDILDTWNDHSRGVATLSGGESFMAALSLALGLSEVVQSYSGGIRLDTLFIDEGFGSLDQESLDRSIEMLKQLQASGRSIGIISHVAELKEQMTQRIDIDTSNFGSTVKLVG